MKKAQFSNAPSGLSLLSSQERSHEIQAEIQAMLGFIPPFFLPAVENPAVLENLWQQTLLAYLNNPLPAVFKEKLSAYLSRFCAVPYCMICHSCSLYALGIEAAAVLELLESPPPLVTDLEYHLRILADNADALIDWPTDPVLEESILHCAVFMALQSEQTDVYRTRLRHLLGITNYHYLVGFIAYVKTCHIWMEHNPQVAYQDDQRVRDSFYALTSNVPELADFFINYWDRVQCDRQTWAERQAQVAERQRHELAMRQVEEVNRYLGRAVASASEGILVTDPYALDNPIIYANPAFLRMTGYSLEEIIGQNCRILQGTETDLEAIARIREAIQDRREVAVTLLNYRKDGQPFWNELKIAPVISEDGELIHFVGLQTDVSERKRSEEALQKQAQLLELAHDAIMVRDVDDRISFWNQGAEKTYGWSADQVLGANSHHLLHTQFPKPLEEIQAELLAHNYWEGELIHLRQDGQVRTITSHWALQRDPEGKPIATLEINTDITEKKALEAQFFRAQRMESIGTLAGGIAHDLNNILTPILSSTQLLLMRSIADERKQRQLLETIQTSARRGGALIKQVLSFARGVEGKRTALQTRHLIAEIRQIAQETFPKSIDIRMDVDADLWLVSGDATQLHQVFMNLCVNARDAMPSGGILSLTATNLRLDEQYTRMNLDAQVGPHTVITVADTGTGMTSDILDRIFDPFFTTKEVGRGTGLGLSTVLAIVKSHGGFIDVQSTLSKGTEFKVYLPAIKATEAPLIEEDEPQAGQKQLVLVVDDEASIRESNQATLEAYNYQVLTAGDGIEAIALYAQRKQEIQAVLVDLMMPVMDGQTTIRTLRKINPQVKIVAVSGLLSNSQLPPTVGSEIQAFLSKPYTAKELVKCLNEVLQTG